MCWLDCQHGKENMEEVYVLDSNNCATCGNFIPPEEVCGDKAILKPFCEKVKPCPFCGWTGINIMNHHHGLYQTAECGNPDCSASVQGTNRDDVIHAWNRRQ